MGARARPHRNRRYCGIIGELKMTGPSNQSSDRALAI